MKFFPFLPLELCSFFLAYIIRAWKCISVLSFFIFFFFSHADCVYSIVFNLSYQVVYLNISNNAFPSELRELQDNSWGGGWWDTPLCSAFQKWRILYLKLLSDFSCVCTGRHTQSLPPHGTGLRRSTRLWFCCVSGTLSLASTQAADTYFGISVQNCSGQCK